MTSGATDHPEPKIYRAATELGFDVCRITSIKSSQANENNLRGYIDAGYHGSMDWMEKALSHRSNPVKLWPEARSIIVLAMNYGPSHNPMNGLKQKNTGLISVYARNRDYHDVIKGKLKILAGKLTSWSSCDVKVFVDTAPVMEKPLAAQAGVGWQGKHTNLVARGFGSWLFLGSIFTTADLVPDSGGENHCGNCRACLDVCPTNAFPAPYRIDARRCLSYLTIENRGPIPHSFRKSMGNRIYGCDDCLAVCPWNKFARQASEIKLQPREDMLSPDLEFLMKLDDVAFRSFFSGSPVKRIGRDRFIRNVLIAVGNSGNQKRANQLIKLLEDSSALVRGAAIWALRVLVEHDLIVQLRKKFLPGEKDQSVIWEWNHDQETE